MRTLIVVLILCGVSGLATEPPRLVIVNNKNLDEYRQAIDGFTTYLENRKAAVRIERIDDWKPGDDTLKGKKTGLIVTMGSLLTKEVIQEANQTPILFMMVADPLFSGIKGPNINGVTLDIAYEQHFSAMQQLLLGKKRIGVLYSPQENQQHVNEAQLEAKRKGLRLQAFSVTSPSSIPPLATLEVDLLWIIPDTTICQPPIIKRILQEGVQNSVPVMGISPQYVKAGALFALSCDYRDIGEQAAAMAERILTGAGGTGPLVEAPRSVKLSINLAVAEMMGITLSEAQLKRASEIFGK